MSCRLSFFWLILFELVPAASAYEICLFREKLKFSRSKRREFSSLNLFIDHTDPYNSLDGCHCKVHI